MSVDTDLGFGMTDPAALAAQRKKASDDAFQGEVNKIKEKGFSTYVKELDEQKLKEMREKLLARMGLTEEDLEAMSTEQRKAIEDTIAQEIQRRLASNTLMNNEDEATTGASGQIFGRGASVALGNDVLSLLQDVGGQSVRGRDEDF